MVVIDLFSGAGGLTEGFAREGYNIVAHIEKDYWACETLRTRICYHWLKSHGFLGEYENYLYNKKSYKDTPLNRSLYITDKHPELIHKLAYSVINKTFGDPKSEEDVISASEAIKLIDNSLKKQHQNNEVSLVIGGPPCQAYSIIGRGRMREKADNDNRNYLFKYYYEIVQNYKPKLFLFENVPGLLTARKGEIWQAIQEDFDGIGYGILSSSNQNPDIVCAKDFGVPQNRKRLILIGYHKDSFLKKPDCPDFTMYKIESKHRKPEHLTTRNAIGDLPALFAGQGSNYWYGPYESEPLSNYQNLMRLDSLGITNHAARPHRVEDLKIYELYLKSVQEGKRLKYSDLPSSLKFHKNKDRDVFQDRFRSHEFDSLPHTIVAHLAKDGHYNIHPDLSHPRSLTVREAARIQSFPDNYYFEGPRTSQFTQVGNAVPPLMAQAYARAIKSLLQEIKG